MQHFQADIIRDKLAKIDQFSKIILDKTNEYCRNEDSGVSAMAQSANREAFCIKTLVNQISGLISRD